MARDLGEDLAAEVVGIVGDLCNATDAQLLELKKTLIDVESVGDMVNAITKHTPLSLVTAALVADLYECDF